MPAILTKFLGPTNTRGSRIKASAHSYVRNAPVSLTLGWDHRLNPSLNHLEAAQALAAREGWAGVWTSIEDVQGGSLWVRDIEQREGFTILD